MNIQQQVRWEVLLLCAVLLQVVDVVGTYHAFTLGVSEFNLVVASIFAWHGYIGLVMFKALPVALTIIPLVCELLLFGRSVQTYKLLWFFVIVMASVAFWHMYWLQLLIPPYS